MPHRAKTARDLSRLLKKGPDFSATFLHLDGITLPPDQRDKLEQEMKTQYRRWFEAWIEIDLTALLFE